MRILFTFLLLVVSQQGMAVDCSGGDITLSTQSDIDDFQSTYGNCDRVTGYLKITESSSGDITSLNGLSAITAVGNYLKVFDNASLSSLSGLDNISSVGDYLKINENGSLANCNAVALLLGYPDGPPDDSVSGEITIDDNATGCNSVIEVLSGYEDALPRYTVTPSAGTGGSINPSTPQTVIEGKTTQFTITPDSNYVIDSVAGSCGGTLSTDTFTTNPITGNCTVEALFKGGEGTACNQNDITLSTQSEVDNFQDTYGSCDTVLGDLTITGTMSDLDGIRKLKNVRGDLTIKGNTNLTDVYGLTNIVSVGKNFVFGPNRNANDQFVQRGNDIDGEASGAESGLQVSLNSDGSVLAIGAPTFNRYILEGSGGVRVYEGRVGIFYWNGSSWSQRGNYLSSINKRGRSGQGLSISGDGSVVAVGTPYYGSGIVDIYRWNGSEWVQRGLTISGQQVDSNTGFSVSLNGDGSLVAVGSFGYRVHYDDATHETPGLVRIFKWNGATWVQQGQDIFGAGNDRLGFHVSLSSDGSSVAISNEDSLETKYFGYTKVFRWNGASWVQQGNSINGTDAYDRLQVGSLSQDGSILAVGADASWAEDAYSADADDWRDKPGYAAVYEWTDSAWTQRGSNISGEAIGDEFGHDVSLSQDGSVLAVGAPLNDSSGSRSGHVRIYEWTGVTWDQLGSDIDGESAGDRSGYDTSISSSGNVIAIGSPSATAIGTDEFGNEGVGLYRAGHVRVYEYSQSSLNCVPVATLLGWPYGESSGVVGTTLVSGNGIGCNSVAEIIASKVTAPDAPTDLSATPGDGKATISFTAGSDNRSTITNYAYSTNGTDFTALSPRDTTSPVTIRGLTNGVTYSISLAAINSIGQSPSSETVSVKPVTVPDAPTGLSAVPDYGSVTISFTPGNDNGEVITNYAYSLNGTTYTPFSPAVTDSPVTITGLSEGVIYSIRLKAISVVGQGAASSAISVTPLTVTAPAAPTNLSAKPGGQDVKISFTPGSSNGASITNYAFRLDDADYIDLDPADSISPVTITGLSKVTSYTVRLKAINARGRSPASEALTFTTTQGFETGIHSLVPGTSCKAADPGNSIKLQSREQGLMNTETEDTLSVICPVALPFTDAIEVIGDTRFSITMYARQGEGADAETTEMSCTLDRYEGQTLLSSQPVQVPLQLETQSSGAVGESLTVSYLGGFTITCDLPPQTAITSIETRAVY